MTDLGAQDWRPSFNESNQSLPRWFADYTEDLANRLGTIAALSLLLWGDSDPVSPVSVGQRLASSLQNSTLHVASGGDHDLARVMHPVIAPLIDAHLSKAATDPWRLTPLLPRESIQIHYSLID